MKLIISTERGVTDVTQLVASVTWSGDKSQCARKLEAEIVSSATDHNISVCDCPLGSGVCLQEGGTTLFSGWIFSREKATGDSTITLTCIDKGIYLKRNEAVYKFTGVTPETITARVCADFGIQTGAIAATGVNITRNFLGVNLYQIIQTAYTLAAQTTGEAYQIRFEGEKLAVIKKTADASALILDGTSNLMSASTSESIENMVNQVNIYDSNEKLISSVKDDKLISAFGRMQSYMKKSEKEDAGKKAKKELADKGIDQKLTVENLGDIRCITGNTVIVREPYTGLSGLFWIDEDTHTWKNGQYYNKLVINYRKMMDEVESGSESR